MGTKLKTLCLIVAAAAFVAMTASIIADSANFSQRPNEVMAGKAWMMLLPSIFSLLCALVYILRDGTKQMAFFYKAFISLFLVSQIAFILSILGGSYLVLTPNRVPPRMIILFTAWIIEYSALLFLAFAPNLGKHTSLILALLAVVMNICIVMMIFKLGFSLSILLRNTSRILFIVLLYLLVVAKYKDKDARGTI